ncbi:MAG: hypothetical protein GY817_04640 [bacterium]|nr:hypothetical protein [bacterium]
MIDWQATKKVIHDWTSGITGIALNRVIWSHGNAPAPSLPYITLEVFNGLSKDGTPSMDYDTEAQKFKSRITKKFTLTVQAFGNMALELLEKIQNGADNPLELEKLIKNGISVVRTYEIANINKLINTEYENRYSMDIDFYISDTNELTGLEPIEKIEMSGNVDDRQILDNKILGGV